MNELQVKKAIVEALKAFGTLPLAEAASGLLEVLGYTSKKRLRLKPNTLTTFLATFSHGRALNERTALPTEWKSVDFIFQLTDDEVRTAADQKFDFASGGAFNGAVINSYLFIAIELKGDQYSRSALAGITREVNKLFDMPVLILFRHGNSLTLAVINRRLHKREPGKDVLEKVTLIRDVQLTNTHRAHIDILCDLSLGVLHQRHPFSNFVGLHEAWQKTLDTSELNKRFFQDLANWYFWALPQVHFPKNSPKDADGQDSLSLIRLITRVIFCWFLKEKGLLPSALFDEHKIPELLVDLNPKESTYYKAILQNLFFATLNQEMGKREFRKTGQNFMAHNVYRYRNLLKSPNDLLTLLSQIPFMNGGLFECLDKALGTKENPQYIRIDGFSDREDNALKIPNNLFWGAERVVDLSEAYGEARFAACRVAGLVRIFDRYKFTVAENTPLDEEIALDPELLGKAFENLLAAYNPETGATARKQTGSFYTPREIVNYMVEESLIRCLTAKLDSAFPNPKATEDRLRQLFAYSDNPHQFAEPEVIALINAIDTLKILDPACGSGAFPMGILHKLVFVLAKLDPGNQRWKNRQLAKANEIPDSTVRERVLADIEQSFTANELDYGRKLYLIENCIYGVDIQPIAVQISKLRFFISLVVEQKVNQNAENRGIRPLPNLETKFVAANTLIGIERPGQQMLRNLNIKVKEDELREIRKRHFVARTPTTKAKCREQDAKLRTEIAEMLKNDGWPSTVAKKLAAWDPYDQNVSASFFDTEWMFGMLSGFDLTIGNPPYVRADEQSDWNKELRESILATNEYETLWEKWDLFVAFIEKGFKLLNEGGVTTMIVSDAYSHSKYAQKSQTWFLQNGRFIRVDFCSKLKIFDAAVHNIIYFFQRLDGLYTVPERRVHHNTFGEITRLPSDEQRNLTFRAFFPEDGVAETFSCEVELLNRICYISKGMVVHADENEVRGEFELSDLVSDHKDRIHSKPFVEGKHLQRWLPAKQMWLEWGTPRAPGLFSRPTFSEIYLAAEKLISVDMSAGVGKLRVAFDDKQLFHNHSAWSFVPWHSLQGVRNNSLKKAARYSGEKPARPDLPKREELEATSRRFSVRYLLGIMNSTHAREFLRANRRSNIHLYPDDWKKLPIPDVPLQRQQPIVDLVQRILDAKRANSNADLTTLEASLDLKVGSLYGITSGADVVTSSHEAEVHVKTLVMEP